MRRLLLPVLAALAAALYVLLLPVAVPRFGAGFAAVSLVPLTLVPWAFGVRSGVLTAVGLAALHYLAFGVFPPEGERAEAQRLVWLGLPFTVVFTAAVAYVRGMQRRLEALNAALSRAALTDSLTGLPNRRALEADLSRAVVEQSGKFALVLIDVDGLKAVNDTQGHARGDALLQAFAAGFERAFAPSGRVYRLSGDEFAVLLGLPGGGVVPDPVETVVAVAGLVDAEFPGAGASAGMSLHRPEVGAADMLVTADRAMYLHKGRPRDGVVRRDDPSPSPAITRRTGGLVMALGGREEADGAPRRGPGRQVGRPGTPTPPLDR